MADRYSTPNFPPPDPKLWDYVGWVVLADGGENRSDATSIPVFRCRNRTCHALLEGQTARLVEHEQAHKLAVKQCVTSDLPHS